MEFTYKRTPTTARIRVEMPDGTIWEVPAQLVADSRDEHYSDEEADTIGFVRAKSLDEFELLDWAASNMNWSDVESSAVKVDAPAKACDFQEGWVNGKREIIGEL